MPETPPFEHKIERVEQHLHTAGVRVALTQNRYAANRKRAFAAHARQLAAQAAADKYRADGHVKAAHQRDRYALRENHIATKNHLRAQHYLASVKEAIQLQRGLETRADALHKHAEEWIKSHGVQLQGNHAVGGDDFERWMTVLLASVASCADGKRRNFYSQTGAWDILHEIVGGPRYGNRSDCSSTVTGWALAAGLGDPNGANWSGGFTGTLRSNSNGWKTVSLTHMLAARKPAFTVYGVGDGHHTEAWCPSDTDRYRTAGHGSAPVDFGTLYLFGTSEFQTFHIYDPH